MFMFENDFLPRIFDRKQHVDNRVNEWVLCVWLGGCQFFVLVRWVPRYVGQVGANKRLGGCQVTAVSTHPGGN